MFKIKFKNGVDGLIYELPIEGITDGVEEVYRYHKLRKQLEHNSKATSYSNEQQLNTLYYLVNK